MTEAHKDKYEKAFVCWVRFLSRMEGVAITICKVYDFEGYPLITSKELVTYKFWEHKLHDMYIRSLHRIHDIEMSIIREAMVSAMALNYKQKLDMIKEFDKEIEEVGGEDENV